MVVLGLLWIPFMKYISSQIYIYLQSVQAYIAPPIAACFLLGLFFRRLNGTGAMASLVTGLAVGLLRLILELANKASDGGLAPGTLWHWIATINFLHFAVLLFMICTAVLFVVSMMTPPPPREKTEGLTYGGAAVTEGETKEDRKFEIGLSVLLVAILGVLWIVFA
jgi:SSS family solute:Na+ symporter